MKLHWNLELINKAAGYHTSKFSTETQGNHPEWEDLKSACKNHLQRQTRNARGRVAGSPDKVTDWLETFPTVQRYLRTVKAAGTKRLRLNHLNWLCILLRETPDEIANMQSDRLREIVKILRDDLLKEGRDSRARGIMVASKMFYNVTDDINPSSSSFIKWRRDEVIPNVLKKAGLEYIPTMAEVWDMAVAVYKRPDGMVPERDWHGRLMPGSGMVWSSKWGHFLCLRNRALVLALAMTGVRKNCIKRWTYGLVRACIEGSCEHDHPVREPSSCYPLYLKITTTLDTKLRLYKVPYYHTFLHKEGALALLEYLDARKAEGWKPRDGSPMFVSEGPLNEHPMGDNSILHAVREAALLATSTSQEARGIWPHQLRKTFRKVINASPTDEDFKTRIMGWRPYGSTKHYADYQDPDEDALKYMAAGFSQTGKSEDRWLVETVQRQSRRIRELQSELGAIKRNQAKS